MFPDVSEKTNKQMQWIGVILLYYISLDLLVSGLT